MSTKEDLRNDFVDALLGGKYDFGEPYDCPEKCTDDKWVLCIYGLMDTGFEKNDLFADKKDFPKKALKFNWNDETVQRDFLSKLILKKK